MNFYKQYQSKSLSLKALPSRDQRAITTAVIYKQLINSFNVSHGVAEDLVGQILFLKKTNATNPPETAVVYKKAFDTGRTGRILIRHHQVNKITKIQIIGCIIVQ